MTAPAMTIGELRHRVNLGADWLDQQHPGWPALVDLSRLDIDDSLNCVLGQVVGDFWRAPMTWAEAVNRGFQVRNGLQYDAETEALNRLWRGLIEQRRAGVNVP
ncbi:hypothetical protein E1211_15310 [Micromonospora sp. 15K316]|uniref:hypothetical protein n=1 Tax=Micromonospora sp. 15K316 TaxID=2530376 RepID=UPI00104EF4DB|nr:hypothetical protein [Micromonospora sp. 15K316]TDC35672.1 hypothetical protein E1211_15310 [Micromonospora sp. 15K316]